MSAANAPLVSLASSEITGPHDLTTRHAMVKLYNQILSRFCASRGHTDCLSFVDINRHLVASSSLLFVDRPKRVGRRFVDDQDPTNIQLSSHHASFSSFSSPSGGGFLKPAHLIELFRAIE